MPRYRYEAVDTAGVPIHGVTEADNESGLSHQMAARRLRLVSSAELSLDSLIGSHVVTLPRLHQLRIGEHLREALLTGLPAPVAVRAIASEPLHHPLAAVAPLLHRIAILLFVALLLLWKYLHMHVALVAAAAFLAFVVGPAFRLLILWFYRWRPGRLLRKLADRLESGESLDSLVPFAAPPEIHHVMGSGMSDEQKARVSADLVTSLSGGNLRNQQFLMTLLGPLLMVGLMLVSLHLAAIVVLPGFRSIFQDFGVELPGLTAVVLDLGRFFSFFGITGWIVTASAIFGLLVLLTVALAAGRLNELLSSVPLFGLVFRWTMQARVARVLAATIRNDCDYAEALQVATAASGFRKVRDHGQNMAGQLKSGHPIPATSRELAGLPISTLLSPATSADRRASIADSFQSLSDMLDTATVGQGRLHAILLQLFTLLFTGLVVGIAILGLFIPLIKLLNDLS